MGHTACLTLSSSYRYCHGMAGFIGQWDDSDQELRTIESKNIAEYFPLLSWLIPPATLYHADTAQVNTNAGARLCLIILP